MKPIEGIIKRDLQEKLGPITSLMAEISPPHLCSVWYAPLSQTPKNSFKRWPSPRNDFVIPNKLFQGPFIPLLWILFGQTGYPIKFFTYK